MGFKLGVPEDSCKLVAASSCDVSLLVIIWGNLHKSGQGDYK